MGASGVIDTIKGATARDAYIEAVRLARYEHGSGGYTGSIAESDGFVIASTTPKLAWEAQQMASQILHSDQVSKWGPTALIPVAEAVSTRQITVPVEVTGMDYEQQDIAIRDAVKAKLRAGESVEAVTTTTDTKTKIATIVTNGEPKTVYIVKAKYGRESAQFPTLTAAKAAAKAALERNPRSDQGFIITKQVVKGDSEVLVTVERQTVRAVTTVTATVGKPKAGPVNTWVTAGWYSE